MQYDGGKNVVFRHIINQIPPHKVSVELFAGSAAVTRHKLEAEINIIVEKNPKSLASVKPLLAARPGMWNFINGDAIQWLKEFGVSAGEDVFIYADPPYLMQTRSCQRELYDCEFGTGAEHRELLTLLCQTSAAVVISGYASSLYDEMLRGWRRVEFETIKRNGKKATEVLWCNFPSPVELHDYSWLGENRTERQRIHRKKGRWIAKLEKLSCQEAQAILSALDDFRRRQKSKMAARPVVKSKLATGSREDKNVCNRSREAEINCAISQPFLSAGDLPLPCL